MTKKKDETMRKILKRIKAARARVSKKEKIILGIALLMIFIPLFYYQGDNINEFIRSKIIKYQIKFTYGMDVDVESVYKSSFYYDSVHGKRKYDEDDNLYIFMAKIDDTDLTIVGYTNNFSVIVCTNIPQIKYADELRKELDECIQEYISPDEYAVWYKFQDDMYSEECSYEEFKENFGYRYVGDAQLYVKTNVSENNFSQIESLMEEKKIPLKLETYKLHPNEESDFSYYKSTQGFDYLYSFDRDEWRCEFFSKLRSNSKECE